MGQSKYKNFRITFARKLISLVKIGEFYLFAKKLFFFQFEIIIVIIKNH